MGNLLADKHEKDPSNNIRLIRFLKYLLKSKFRVY